jgi:hypothetical protein
MELQQIFVYDKQNCFFRFLNYKFNNIFIFNKIKSKEIYTDSENYPTIFYVIYSEEDLKHFFKIYCKNFRYLVCSHNNYVLNRMKNISNVAFIDTSRTKY